MTTPGSRGAQQAYQQQVQQNFSNFQRNSAHNQRYLAGRGGRGPVRRFVGFVFSLVFIAIAIGVFLTILSVAEPHWFDHVSKWFDQIF